MKRLFISTNVGSISSMYIHTLQQEFKNYKDNFNLLLENEIICFDDENNKFIVPFASSNNCKIILIKDTMNSQRLKDFSVDAKTDYLLYHSITITNIGNTNIKSYFNASKLGNHVRNINKYYDTVFDIFLDKENNKFERIMGVLFPSEEEILETKLILLHQCLAPEGLEEILWEDDGTIKIIEKVEFGEATYTILPTKIKENGAKDIFTKLSLYKDKGPFGLEYINALKDLRDVLLPSLLLLVINFI